MSTTISVKMKKSKKTKNTYVYASEDSLAAVPTLYIKKSAFPPGTEGPERIEVTINGV